MEKPNTDELMLSLSRKIDVLKRLMRKFTACNVHMAPWSDQVRKEEDNFDTLMCEFLANNIEDEFKSILCRGVLEGEHKAKQYLILKRAFGGFSTSSSIVVHPPKSVIDLETSLNGLIALASPVNELILTLSSDVTGKNSKRFTQADLSTFTSNFSEKIDENLYKGIFPNGVQVVVKILTEIDVVEPIFIVQLNKMFNVRHRNLVKLYGFCFEKDLKALVFEYIPNGSLDRILFDNNHTNMEWEKLYNIATETAKVLSYLHEGCEDELLHCDIKASNVLLDQNMRPKVTNYGVFKLTGKEEWTHFAITELGEDVSYMAPERLMVSFHVTQKSDVYTFGMMLFEVLGKRKIDSRGTFFPSFISDMLEQGKVEEIMKECDIPEKNREKAMILCMVAFWCTQYTPENRPSMSTVVMMLEHLIKVEKPPTLFFPDRPYSVKPFVGATYDSSDFGPSEFRTMF